MEGEELISLEVAAVRSGISARTLRWLAVRGRLKATKVGNTWVTTWSAVTEYLNDPEKRSKDPYKYKRR